MAKLNARFFSSLIYFEACGRLLSFSGAARELCVTTGAISQQIRKLEEQLGFKLFQRHSWGIELTLEGRELLLVSQQSVDALEAVIERLQAKLVDDVIRLQSVPSFVFKWLIPKLKEFNLDYPDIKVEIYADAALLELAGASFDLAIDYSKGGYQDFEASLLGHETLQPVVSPNYRPELDWQAPDIWSQVSLLHDALPWLDAPRDADWRYWFDQSGWPTASSETGHYFNRSDITIAAAEAGLGVALARGSLVKDELANGALVAPFAAVLSNCDYYVLMPKGRALSKNAYVLRDWLLNKA